MKLKIKLNSSSTEVPNHWDKRMSKWDQKSCQIGIFITVLMSHGTKNVHKT